MIAGGNSRKLVLGAVGLIAALVAICGVAAWQERAGPGPVVQAYAAALTSYDLEAANALLEREAPRWRRDNAPHRMLPCVNPVVVDVDVDGSLGFVTVRCENTGDFEATYAVVKEAGGWKVRKRAR